MASLSVPGLEQAPSSGVTHIDQAALDRSKTVGAKSDVPLETTDSGTVVPWESRQKHKGKHYIETWAAVDYDVDAKSRKLPQDPNRAAPTRQQTTHFDRPAEAKKPPPHVYQFPKRRHSFSGIFRGERELKKKRGHFLEELRIGFHAAPPLPKSRGDRCRPPDAKREYDDPSLKYDPDLHSDVALLHRESLRYDGSVLKWLNKFWLLAIADSGNRKELRFEKYKKFHANMYRSLHHQWNPMSALQTAVQDWDIDSMGFESLNKARFLRCLFEVADVWTNHVQKKQYLGFLRHLFDHVSFYDLDAKVYRLKRIEDVKIGATAKAAAGDDWVTGSMRERDRTRHRQAEAERLQQHWRERKRREDPNFRERKKSLLGPPAPPASQKRRNSRDLSATAPAAPASLATPSIDESTYEHLLGRRRSASAVGMRRSSLAPEDEFPALSEPLFGWNLVRALYKMGPGFAKRVEEGPPAVALARAARAAVRDYFAEHGRHPPLPQSRRQPRAGPPRPGSRAGGAGGASGSANTSVRRGTGATPEPRMPGLGELPPPISSSGNPDTARLRDAFMAVATTAAEAYAARTVIAYPVRASHPGGAPAAYATGLRGGGPQPGAGNARPNSVGGPFAGGVGGARPSTSPDGGLPGVAGAPAHPGGRPVPPYRRPGTREVRKPIPTLSAVPLVRVSVSSPSAATLGGAGRGAATTSPAGAGRGRGAPAVAPAPVSLPPIGLSVKSAKRQ